MKGMLSGIIQLAANKEEYIALSVEGCCTGDL